ncbi:MAG: hypothetical protein HFI24_10115 [Lachnospiraceae bacterium]|nr:hypothetical protein [Lachnospiraceae bacterium]MCI9478523.1 hypothetical protein [Lachnospiraceae bacterium]
MITFQYRFAFIPLAFHRPILLFPSCSGDNSQRHWQLLLSQESRTTRSCLLPVRPAVPHYHQYLLLYRSGHRLTPQEELPHQQYPTELLLESLPEHPELPELLPGPPLRPEALPLPQQALPHPLLEPLPAYQV